MPMWKILLCFARLLPLPMPERKGKKQKKAMKPLGDPLPPGIREEVEQARRVRLRIILVRVLHIPAIQNTLSLEVAPFRQAEIPAIMLQLDGSPALGCDLRGVHRLLLLEPLLGVLEGPDLCCLDRHKVHLLLALPASATGTV